MASLRTLLGVALLILLCSMCIAATPKPVKPVPKGDRLLAIDVNPAENGSYNAAFSLAKSIGMQVVGLSLDWKDIETAPYTYDGKWLSIANVYYPASGTAVTLTLRPVHTHRKMVPDDLADLPFDDPRMINRFKRLLDFVFTQIPELKLDAVVIGSEFDIHLGTDKVKWRQYTEFYRQTGDYVRRKRPGTKVAAEATLKGLTGYGKAQLLELNKLSDVVGVSHYPIKDDFGVDDPSVIGKQIDSVVSLYPRKSISFYQFGYPSSPDLGSSEEKQAAFIREAFRAWDRHAGRIRLIDFTWLHDISKAALDQNAEYYGLSHPRFLAFLGSLGLRTYPGAGTDKKALEVLRSEARVRGWGQR